MCLLMAGILTSMAAPRPKMLYDRDQAISVFVYDENTYSAGDTFTTDTTTITVSFSSVFFSANQNAKRAIFDASCADYYPTSTNGMFWACNQLTSIEHIEYLNTSQVTNMGSMFYVCPKLTSIDLSHFDTHNVTNMSEMFSHCSSLTEFDFNALDYSSAVNMSEMFSYCTGLTEIDLSGITFPAATNMNRMFLT